MPERIAQFGPANGLLGVLTEPANAQANTPAVLLLNAGVLHRVGPLGWYVELARRLARLGCPVLRFDLAGIGDSPVRADNLSEVERALADITSAMDYLARTRQVSRFVLIGLCSGAMFAHHAAVRDARIAGAVLLDGYGYRTLGYWRRYAMPRLLRRASWLNLLRRFAARFTARAALARHPREPQAETYFLDFPPRAQMAAELRTLLARGTALHFLYSGGLATQYFNDARQFREMYGDLDPTGTRLTVVYDERADHLYCDLAARAAMLARIEGWMAQFIGSEIAERAQASGGACPRRDDHRLKPGSSPASLC
jgi:pimeloyl-ACP methyl ester carboxylesterase